MSCCPVSSGAGIIISWAALWCAAVALPGALVLATRIWRGAAAVWVGALGCQRMRHSARTSVDSLWPGPLPCRLLLLLLLCVHCGGLQQWQWQPAAGQLL